MQDLYTIFLFLISNTRVETVLSLRYFVLLVPINIIKYTKDLLIIC